MNEFEDYCRVKAKVIKDTGKALLVEIEGMDEQVWIPQSQIDDRSDCWKEGDEGDLVISQWIANKKGIE